MFGFRLGRKKTASTDKRLGTKVSDGVRAGAKTAYHNVERVGGIAGMVSSVAGKVSGLAGTGATLAALTGFGVPVATALGGVAAGAKALQAGADVVGGVAGRATEAKQKVEKARATYSQAMSFMG